MVFISSAWASAELRIVPAPAWIDELEMPESRAERLSQVKGGIYYLIWDEQSRPDKQSGTSYMRTAYKVVDRHGLEAAGRLEIGFDPSYQALSLHYVRVWRQGVALNRLERANIEIMRRETDLDSGVVDGRHTAYIELHDVQVGDIIDYAYSIKSKHIFWPGHAFGDVQTSWSVPVALSRFRVSIPKNVRFFARVYGVSPAYTEFNSADRIVYEWRGKDVEPVAYEDNAPAWHDHWGRISYSTMENWKGVVDWALPYYSNKEHLPASVAARVDDIILKFDNPHDRITEALRHVQDSVRYVSVSIGIGSFVRAARPMS